MNKINTKSLGERLSTSFIYGISVVLVVFIDNIYLSSIYFGFIMIAITLEIFKCFASEKNKMRYVIYFLIVLNILYLFFDFKYINRPDINSTLYQEIYLHKSYSINLFNILSIIIVSVFALFNLYKLYKSNKELEEEEKNIEAGRKVNKKRGVIKITKESLKNNANKIFYFFYLYTYLIVFPIHLIKYSYLTNGKIFLILLYIIVISTDSFAYILGSLFGKMKFIKISPKKTIMGSISGIVFTVTSILIYIYILKLMYGKIMFNIPATIILGMFLSIIAQMGDILASYLKRINNKKDFGSILPGHGGILDRCDALIFTAPFLYYMLPFIVI